MWTGWMAWPGLVVHEWIICKLDCNCRTKNLWRNAVLWFRVCLVCRDDDRRREGELTQVMSLSLTLMKYCTVSLTLMKYCTLSEHVNAQDPEAFASSFSSAAASIVIIVKIYHHKKKYDLWGKIEVSPAATHFHRSLQDLIILPHCSASSHIPLISNDPSKYISLLCNGQWPHCTSLLSNYVFTVSRSRRWGI